MTSHVSDNDYNYDDDGDENDVISDEVLRG